ncbi:DUF4123 domain-containing protein [Trinickia sp. NRRL B-1857]|uniref:DUF4123 domain-containing protein n=1 Tax=Trinickia sp. NRRL B-1857 TaxID=3162879 RepID=UPI003D265509
MNDRELIEQLQLIAAEQRDGLSLYCLLDSTVYAAASTDEMGKSYGDLAAELIGAKAEPLFAYAFNDARADASPLLVSIPALEGDLAAQIAALAVRYHLASWVWSPLSRQVLAQHFARFIRAEFGATAAILRPYDPRIMEDTIACFDFGRQAALWRPLSAWSYLDEDDVLKQLQRPVWEPASELSCPLRLDRNEQDRFEGLANRIALAGYIEAHGPSIMESLTSAERKAFCIQQLEIGERLGKRSMGDLFIVAALSGAHGVQWIDDTRVGHLVQSVTAGNVSLAAVAAEIGGRLEQRG